MVVRKNSFLSFLLLGLSFLLTACGGDKKSGKNHPSVVEAQEEGDPGVYRVVLSPVNSTVAGEVSGTMEVRIEGDEFVVEGTVAGAPAGVKHLQSIMSGVSCPDLNDDINGDGIVDVQEGRKRYGQILIPLDSNLSEQIAGMDYGPIANGSGAYVYRRSTTLSMLLSDLHAPDPDIRDAIAKIRSGDDLKLAGRVILIHGVSPSAELPVTVESVADLKVHESLPIACGKLVRIVSENVP